MSSTAVYFDELYKSSDDPWHLREGWYEHRKRSLTLALLPRPRYRNAFEPGCANGELPPICTKRPYVLHANVLPVCRKSVSNSVGCRSNGRPKRDRSS
jgi:hypothetical protein